MENDKPKNLDGMTSKVPLSEAGGLDVRDGGGVISRESEVWSDDRQIAEINKMNGKEFMYLDRRCFYNGGERITPNGVLHNTAMKIWRDHLNGESLSKLMGEEDYRFVYGPVNLSGVKDEEQRPSSVQERLINTFFIFSQVNKWYRSLGEKDEKTRTQKVSSYRFLLNKYSEAFHIDFKSDFVSRFADEQLNQLGNFKSKLEYLSSLRFFENLFKPSKIRINEDAAKQLVDKNIDFCFNNNLLLDKLVEISGPRKDVVTEMIHDKLKNRIANTLLKIYEINFSDLSMASEGICSLCHRFKWSDDYEKFNLAVSKFVGDIIIRGKNRWDFYNVVDFGQLLDIEDLNIDSDNNLAKKSALDLVFSILNTPIGQFRSTSKSDGVMREYSVTRRDGLSWRKDRGNISQAEARKKKIEIAYNLFSKFNYDYDDYKRIKNASIVNYDIQQFCNLIKSKFPEPTGERSGQNREYITTPLITGNFYEIPIEMVDFEILDHGDRQDSGSNDEKKSNNSESSNKRYGFGERKVARLRQEARTIMERENINSTSVRLYKTELDGKEDKSLAKKKPDFDHYYALAFESDDIKFVIAEGEEDISATYVWVGDADSGDEWKDDFQLERLTARRVSRIKNLNHMGDDLDLHWSRIYNVLLQGEKVKREKFEENEMNFMDL